MDILQQAHSGCSKFRVRGLRIQLEDSISDSLYSLRQHRSDFVESSGGIAIGGESLTSARQYLNWKLSLAFALMRISSQRQTRRNISSAERIVERPLWVLRVVPQCKIVE
jgi:hypothetical protein